MKIKKQKLLNLFEIIQTADKKIKSEKGYRLVLIILLLLLCAYPNFAQQEARSYFWNYTRTDSQRVPAQQLFNTEYAYNIDYDIRRIVNEGEGWHWMNPRPQGNDLGALHLFTSGDAIALGSKGTKVVISENGANIVVSYNAGGFTGLILDVEFVDDYTGFAVGTSGAILKSTDNGNSWQIIPSGTNRVLNGISFATNNIGVIVAERGNMLRTTDGGQTWLQLPIVTQQHLYEIIFVTEQKGFAIGFNGTMLRTEDAGATWVIHNTAPNTDKSLYSISSSDTNTITVVGGGFWGGECIYRSTDGGITWVLQMIDQSQGVFADVSFINNDIGVAVGTNGIIFRTTNGGTEWLQIVSGISTTLIRVTMQSDGSGYAVGIAGEILKTINYGADWFNLTQRVTSNFLTGVSFTNAYLGSAVGDAGTILRTTNGGEVWFKQTPPQYVGPSDHYHAVSFADSIYGNAAGVFGLLSRTSDGGNSWDWQYVRSSDTTFFLSLYALDLLNPDTGLVVGQLSIIGRLLNRNNNIWTKINHGQTNKSLFGVQMVNSYRSFAVGEEGTILRSTNGGAAWTKQVSNTFETLWSVHFSSEDVGTVVGSNGTILRTTNGGITWLQQVSTTTANLFGVKFHDNNFGLAIGAGGMILRTTDGGNNWHHLISPTSHSLRGINILNADTAFVTGGGGTILCTFNRGGVVSVNDLTSKNLPAEFILEQNYPNPFNPTTTIRFALPATGWVQLKIYNALGQEINTLFEGEVTKGYHSVQWNSTNREGAKVSSGIYFYNINVDVQSKVGSTTIYNKTGKMMLLK